MSLKEKISDFIVPTLMIGGLIFGSVSHTGGFGSRGEKEVYSFQYGGKRAAVIEDDRRFSPNKYWIQLMNGDSIHTGTITSDDNREVRLIEGGTGTNNYEVIERKK